MARKPHRGYQFQNKHDSTEFPMSDSISCGGLRQSDSFQGDSSSYESENPIPENGPLLVRERRGVSVHVDSLCYTVRKRQFPGLCPSRRAGYSALRDGDIPVLTDVSLHLKQGRMLAILGSSGSGKTSLLDCLACRTAWGSTQHGEILFNGQPVTQQLFRAHGAYVMQDDTLLTYLTVRETLTYVASLKLPARLSKDEHRLKVDSVIQQLGLKVVENSVIGGVDVRGVSGGERRRVSIGIQLLMEPDVLLLDEPTSGLDSHTAHHLVAMLARLAKHGNHTIFLTIHQPRSDMFTNLDQVMILSRGETVFCGGADRMVDYFTSIGHQCPAYTNPLDEYVDVSSVDTRQQDAYQLTECRVDRLKSEFRSSQFAEAIRAAHPRYCQGRSPTVSFAHVSVYPSSREPHWLFKIWIIFCRNNSNLLRNHNGISFRLFQMLFFSLVLELFFFRLGHDQASVQDRVGYLYQVITGPLFIGMFNPMALFTPLRSLMYHEVRDGLYNTPAFLLGYLLHIVPFSVASALLFSTFSYWAVGMVPVARSFISFSIVVCCLHFVGEAVGVFSLALFTNPTEANSICALYFSLTALLSSGFLRTWDSLPTVLRYLSYGASQRYASEILVAEEYLHLKLTCPPQNETHQLPCLYPSGPAYIQLQFPGAPQHHARNFLCISAFCIILYLFAMAIFAIRSCLKRR